MILAEKYEVIFKKECYNLLNIILNNLYRLNENPKDYCTIEKIIQTADTMKGDSRFINNNQLENASMLLVKTFNNNENVIEKSTIKFFIDLFKKIKKEQNLS